MDCTDDKDCKSCQCVLESSSQLQNYISYRDAPCISRKQMFPATILKRGTYQATHCSITQILLFYFSQFPERFFCSCHIRVTMASKSRLSPQQSDEHPIWVWHTCIAVAQSIIFIFVHPLDVCCNHLAILFSIVKRSRRNTCRLEHCIKNNKNETLSCVCCTFSTHAHMGTGTDRHTRHWIGYFIFNLNAAV